MGFIKNLLSKLTIEENGICPTCTGNGKYMQREDNGDGTVSTVWYFCEDCDGTGEQGTHDTVD